LPHSPEPETGVATPAGPAGRRAHRRAGASRGASRLAAIAAEPFLKWAGGKRQLLPEIRRCYPDDFGTYFEPFLGSGAVFFDLLRHGRLERRRAVLSDTNADVIGCCRVVRDQPGAVIAHLRRLAEGHARGGTAHYYDVRDRRFNPVRARLDGLGSPGAIVEAYTPALAAMLIYLNRTGFNGLFRLNSLGEFNVPIGRYANPSICDDANLRLVAVALVRHAVLTANSFESVLEHAVPGDFVYFDPPYVPLGPTARFTAYTADGFGDEDHVRLQQVVVALARRGCAVVLSNSTAPLVRSLYDRNAEARAAGLKAHLVRARRSINCVPGARAGVFEYLITNVPARRLAHHH
jgi:DNA adenine methylase